MSHTVPQLPSGGNPLEELIPQKSRNKFYAWFSLLGILFGATQIAFLVIKPDLPTWLIICILVYNFLGGFVGLLAKANPRTPSGGVVL